MIIYKAFYFNSNQELTEPTDDNSTEPEPKREGTTEVPPEETYEEKIKRLECENPWFWNSFECYLLDRNNGNKRLPRAKQNFHTAGVVTGIACAIVFGPIVLMISKRYLCCKLQ